MTAPTFAEIRKAITDTIEAGIQTEIYVYPKVPDVVQCPAVVVSPTGADYVVNMGLDSKYEFDLFILVTHSNAEVAQDQLDGFVDGAGPDSMRRALYQTPALGLSNIDAMCYAMTKYGGSFVAAQVQHIGAVLKVRVEADP